MNTTTTTTTPRTSRGVLLGGDEAIEIYLRALDRVSVALSHLPAPRSTRSSTAAPPDAASPTPTTPRSAPTSGPCAASNAPGTATSSTTNSTDSSPPSTPTGPSGSPGLRNHPVRL